MKKKLLLLVVGFLTFSSFGQNNVAKLNLTGFAFGNIGLSYERVLGENTSAGLTFSFTPAKELAFREALMAQASEQDDNLVLQIYESISMSGISFTPEFRIYTSSERETPRGFYIAPYFNYTAYNMKADFIFSEPDGNQVDYTLDGTYTALGGGFALGYQLLIGDVVSLDITFLPLGIGSGTATINVNAIGYDENLYDEIKDEAERDFGIIKTELNEVSDTEVELVAKALIPVLNFGIKLGVAF